MPRFVPKTEILIRTVLITARCKFAERKIQNKKDRS